MAVPLSYCKILATALCLHVGQLLLVMNSFGMATYWNSVSPGFQIQLSQSGLNYGANVSLDIVAKIVSQIKIPDQSGSAQTPVGKVYYDITNIRVTNFVKPVTNVIVNPGSGLTWQLSNAAISLSGNWHYKYKLGFIVIQDSGTFDGDVSGVTVSVSVTLGLDSSGHPTISSTGCQCHINAIEIHLHGGASWFYNLFISRLESPIRNNLQSQVCVAAKKAIDENARAELATLPIQIIIDNTWLFDYRLVLSPVFRSGYLESYHKGEFFFKGDTVEAPFQAAPFPDSSPGRMVTFMASDYILDTVGYVLHKQRILVFNLTKNDVPPEDRGYLNTTCTSFLCFGFLIPQAGKAFPNASVEMEMESSSPPTANITTSGIDGHFAGLISYKARLSNGSLAPMFKTKVYVIASATVSLRDMVLRANVTQILPNITIVDSQIGPISNFVLMSVFKVILKVFIIPKLNEAGQKGIPLPGIKDVQFMNTELVFESRCLLISTDVHYSPSTVLHFKPVIGSSA